MLLVGSNNSRKNSAKLSTRVHTAQPGRVCAGEQLFRGGAFSAPAQHDPYHLEAFQILIHNEYLELVSLEHRGHGSTPAIRGNGLEFAHEDLIASNSQVRPRFLFRDLAAINQVKRLRIGINQKQFPFLIEANILLPLVTSDQYCPNLPLAVHRTFLARGSRQLNPLSRRWR